MNETGVEISNWRAAGMQTGGDKESIRRTNLEEINKKTIKVIRNKIH